MKSAVIIAVMTAFISHVGAEKIHPSDYQFKQGYWRIEAKAMKPDQSHDIGSGYEHVFINDVGVSQDELCIDMQEMPDAVGATMRTFDPINKLWHITWVAQGTASGTGTATDSGQGLVESFPGEDQHGTYLDQMSFTVFNSDHYKANLTRTYTNGGYKLDCIWCYEAKRIAKDEMQTCKLNN